MQKEMLPGEVEDVVLLRNCVTVWIQALVEVEVLDSKPLEFRMPLPAVNDNERRKDYLHDLAQEAHAFCVLCELGYRSDDREDEEMQDRKERQAVAHVTMVFLSRNARANARVCKPKIPCICGARAAGAIPHQLPIKLEVPLEALPTEVRRVVLQVIEQAIHPPVKDADEDVRWFPPTDIHDRHHSARHGVGEYAMLLEADAVVDLPLLEISGRPVPVFQLVHQPEYIFIRLGDEARRVAACQINQNPSRVVLGLRSLRFLGGQVPALPARLGATRAFKAPYHHLRCFVVHDAGYGATQHMHAVGGLDGRSRSEDLENLREFLEDAREPRGEPVHFVFADRAEDEPPVLQKSW